MSARRSLAVVGLDLAAGIVWALVFACDANDRLIAFPGWLRGIIFALPPAVLSLVVFLPLVGGGLFGTKIGAGPLPVIGNIILHLVYGAVLGGDVRPRWQHRPCWHGDPGDGGDAAAGGGRRGLGRAARSAVRRRRDIARLAPRRRPSAATIAGAAIGGAVVGAALGMVFGSMAAMTNGPYRAPTEERSPDGTITHAPTI